MIKDIFKKIIIFKLTCIARLALRKYKPKIIAVSGSVGKTSTKDGVFTILSPFLDIRKSQKSYNGEIGVPLSILNLPNKWNSVFGWIQNCFDGLLLVLTPHHYPKYLVLEVGADKPGEVSGIARFIKPDYAIITRLPDVPAHVEFFENAEAVNEEDKLLAKYTKKDGILILNHDDRAVLSMRDQYPQKSYTYGVSKDADLFISSFSLEKKNNHFVLHAALTYKKESVHIDIPDMISETQCSALLPGILIGLLEGISLSDLVSNMKKSEDTKGRLYVMEGIQESVLIDDTYNSSPVAVMNSLSVLKGIPETKRKIAVLGDMLELGTHTEEEHRKIGFYAAKHVDFLVAVGIRSKFTHDEAQKAGIKNSRWFETSVEAGEFLKDEIKKGDTILLKGSQSIRMEKAVELLMQNPELKRDLLVRQDEEWDKR